MARSTICSPTTTRTVQGIAYGFGRWRDFPTVLSIPPFWGYEKGSRRKCQGRSVPTLPKVYCPCLAFLLRSEAHRLATKRRDTSDRPHERKRNRRKSQTDTLPPIMRVGPIEILLSVQHNGVGCVICGTLKYDAKLIAAMPERNVRLSQDRRHRMSQ